MRTMNGDRLTGLDSSFLHMERAGAHMHVATTIIFEGSPPSHEEFRDQIESRLHLVPRFRQKLRFVPFEQGRPVWVDDPFLNLDYHVRRTALPAPGSEEQLRNLAARIFSQQLDRTKPLWEMWLVEGLVDDRFAVVGKMLEVAAATTERTTSLTVPPCAFLTRLKSSRSARTKARRRWGPISSLKGVLGAAAATSSILPVAPRSRSTWRGPRRAARRARTNSRGLVARSCSASLSRSRLVGSGRGAHFGGRTGGWSGASSRSKRTVVMSTPETPSTTASPWSARVTTRSSTASPASTSPPSSSTLRRRPTTRRCGRRNLEHLAGGAEYALQRRDRPPPS